MDPQLIVAAVPAPHIFEHRTQAGGRSTFAGFEGRFLQTILDFLALDYTFTEPPDREWGRKNPNGTWTGVIGMVQRGEADMGFNLMSITDSRRRAVDYSDPYAIDGSSFPVQKFDIPPSPLTLLNPFDIPTWMFFTVSWVVTAVTLNLVAFGGKGPLGHLFMVLMANVLNQSMSFGRRRSKKTNLLMSFWYFLALMLSFGYSAVLLAILSIPMQETPIKDFPQLADAVRKGTRGCAIVKGTSLLSNLLESSDRDLRDIGTAIQDNDWLIRTGEEETVYRRERFVIIKSTIIASTFSNDAILRSSTRWSENVDMAPLAIALRTGFCCKPRVNLLVSRIAASGLYGKYMRDQGLKRWLQKPGVIPAKGRRVKPLGLGDLSGAFVVLAVGHVLSLAAFVGEKCHYKRGRKMDSEIFHKK